MDFCKYMVGLLKVPCKLSVEKNDVKQIFSLVYSLSPLQSNKTSGYHMDSPSLILLHCFCIDSLLLEMIREKGELYSFLLQIS